MRDDGESPGAVELGHGLGEGDLEVHVGVRVQLEAHQVGDHFRVGLGPARCDAM